ncbi:hypothetical protein [Allobaculum stercoricanis]|uniref:hypothetical protein n=1 Tax=Allobaculum stercoricanis TaxID=174709 RepID=UPI0003674245|nr:hypothetical protein [Allobaculum stercoricanis]
MNKKFFAALASATMAFTASGSIAVFADDFVEEKDPVIDNGDVKPVETEVVWNKDNFGALVKEGNSVFEDKDSNGLFDVNGNALVEGKKVKTADLEKVENITLTGATNGEIKGLEYFTGLKTFNANAATKITNNSLDFSANKVLGTLSVTKAEDLTEIVLPEPVVTEKDGKEVVTYSLKSLTLSGTALTSLDLSAQNELANDGSVVVTNNNNLKEVTVKHGTKFNNAKYASLDLTENNLATIDLANTTIGTLKLNKNHIGALDLSDTTVNSTLELKDQTFYVSETLENVNLAETFENFDKEAAKATGNAKYDEKTGILTIKGTDATYEYNTLVNGPQSSVKLSVTLTAANPMNRLYNPNSGEHFYTADLKEKEALVKLGWNDEGYGWVAPKMTEGDKVVYRLYNPNAGDHHYTVSATEKKTLVSYGWKYEGEGWKSAAKAGNTPVYRQYNPYANGAGSHNYTTDKAENDYLVSLGWTPEGTAWYGLQ